MEGLVDAPLRAILTSVGGIDWCVSEFVRITNALLPRSALRRAIPELDHHWRTPSGVEVRLQLLGSDAQCLAENAAQAAAWGAPVIDLNFGCPAKIVNRHGGGAVLLQQPEALAQVVAGVRAAVPATVPVTAKMRLGYHDTELTLDCARAIATAGAASLVVHARTKAQGYQPPAHWEWIARIAEVVDIPLWANGDIWSVADYQRCRAESGVSAVMLGRGLVSCPDLALQIRALEQSAPYQALTWEHIQPLVVQLLQLSRQRIAAKHVAGRVKQWLHWLARTYPAAAELFKQTRHLTTAEALADRIS